MRRHCLFELSLKVLVTAQLIRSLLDERFDCNFENVVETLHLLIFLEHIFDVALTNAPCHLSMLLSLLTQFLPFRWVVGGCSVSCGLLCEDILNREDFIEKLELQLGSLAVLLTNGLALELSNWKVRVNLSQLWVNVRFLMKWFTYFFDVLEAINYEALY